MKLRTVIIGLLAGASALCVISIAAAALFADPYSRPIASSSPAPRTGQLFTVWYSVANNGPDNATDVVLTINPISDPNVTVHSVTSIRPCSGSAPIVCTLGTVDRRSVITVGVRYQGLPGNYPTSQVLTGSNDSNPANNAASAVITINP
jgi:hypothetical protein